MLIMLGCCIGGNIEWVEHPMVRIKEKKRGVRRAVGGFKSRIPRILRDIAPATVFDPHVAWKKQKIADGLEEAQQIKQSEKIREQKEKNTKKRAKDNYKTDMERIHNKMKEGGM